MVWQQHRSNQVPEHGADHKHSPEAWLWASTSQILGYPSVCLRITSGAVSQRALQEWTCPALSAALKGRDHLGIWGSPQAKPAMPPGFSTGGWSLSWWRFSDQVWILVTAVASSLLQLPAKHPGRAVELQVCLLPGKLFFIHSHLVEPAMHDCNEWWPD